MLNSRYRNLTQFFRKESVLLSAYVGITLLASIQQYLLPDQPIGPSVQRYSNYNNYVIFERSFDHLLANKNLYILYLTEQWDLFKYSPTFALGMGLLAFLPAWLGLTVWNLLNTLVLFFGIKHLPVLTESSKVKIRWFILIELLTSIQNSQSNGLIAGLLIWSFIWLERGKSVWATLLMLLSVFIKIFGVVGFVLFWLYPRKSAAFLYTAVWTVLLMALPLLVVSDQALLAQYQNWWAMLQTDHSNSVGLSVMGWLTTWFSLDPSKLMVVLTGAVLLVLPLLRTSQYKAYQYRLMMLASVLVWVVIFNHKAESPTFILAIAGVGLWYFSQPVTVVNRVLVIATFIFTSLSSTDVFPAFLRDQLVLPYVLKGFFCIAVWAKITADLLMNNWISGEVIVEEHPLVLQ
ncbi:glycosyltransferase family 87 protein [Spirosoma aerophilum]